jgi:hypothetical protein
MHARILVWSLVATLTLGSAPALAQDAAAPAPALSLSATNATAAGAAGSTVTYALHVASDAARNVTLSFDPLPDGLSGSFDGSTLAVGPDAPASAAFTVAIAPDAHGDEPIPIAVHATGDDGANASLSLALGIEAAPRAVIAMSPDPAAIQMSPGESAYDNVTIVATGAPATVSIGTFAPPGFTASSWPVSLDLQPGVAQSFRVAIDAGPNASGPAVVTLVASDQTHATRSATIRIEVPASSPPPPTSPPPTAPSFVFRMEPSTQRVAPGGYATFVLHAKATRNVTLDLGVGQMSDDAWSTAFTPLSIDVAAGGEAQAKLLVRAPANATGAVRMDVLARARDTMEQRDAWIGVGVRNASPPPTAPSPTAPSFMLGATPQRQPLGADGTASFTVGAKSMSAVTLQLGLGRAQVAGYHAELQDATLDVPAGSYAKTQLVVTAPDNASDGPRDVPVEVYAIAPNGERHAVTVHVLVGGDDKPASPAASSPPPAAPSSPTAHRPVPAALNDSSVSLALQGFDGLGGLRILLQIGDRTVELHVGEQLLRQLAEPTNDIGGDTGHHSRAWLRLQLDPEVESS